MSRCLAAAYLALLAAAPAAVRAECTLAAATIMPMRIEKSHFLVPAKINGHASNLVVDTGAFATMLNVASTRRLGITVGWLGRQASGIGGARDLYVGTVSHMKLGQMNADGMTLGAATLWDEATGPTADGLFGMNMMAAYDIDLDVPGSRFVLYQAQGSCSHPTVALSQPLYMVHLMSSEHNREVNIEIVIDGRRIRAGLDTGASSTTMYRKTAARLGVDLSPLFDRAAHTTHGIGELAVPEIKHVFPTVEIGDLEIHNMPVTILAQKDSGIDHRHVGSLLETPDEEGSQEMLLGADFLQMVHVWISNSSQTLIMQYPPKPSPLGQ